MTKSIREERPERSDQWADVQERGSYYGMRVVAQIYRYGGKFLLGPIVWGVVAYFFITRSAPRRYSRCYLQRVSQRPVSRWMVWRHHLAFGQALLDRVGAWLGKIDRHQVNFPRRRVLLDLQAQQKGAILLGAHLGNLEMCRAVVENGGYMKLNVILHSHNTEKINQLMQDLNPRVEVRLIQISDINPATAMRLRALLDQGEFLILLADRLPPGEPQRCVEQDFLGAPARFPLGPFWLALLLGVPVYFMAGLRGAEGYRVVLEPLSDGQRVARKEREAACRKILASYVKKLEDTCRAYPYQWFNFYDYWQDDAGRMTKSETPSTTKNQNARQE